ncbi:hypothetical protein PRIPAC_86858 [Pristionchus pacificus]|uniref:Uncharacterized protein n=1 Tax=Pristionchus pacificus TaxID=54126 RepID=A0A2A6BNK4_PRIPA|nr:hypothetical protein PRIPAC_86858 [Pristionchus pacificus]|eukprot:PDM67497.1 hypothetical protein PRIPAC_48914 [Pristionchus pacificus]
MIGGRVVYEDGAVYHGDFLNNLEHGLGTMKRSGGRSLFAGRWSEGFEELGVLDENGITFAGQWSRGRRDGLGTESSRNVTFSGDWTEGAQSRYGVADYTNNESCYMGIWVDSKPEEYGIQEYADSGTYCGQWLNGRKTGFGVRTSGQYGSSALAMILSRGCAQADHMRSCHGIRYAHRSASHEDQRGRDVSWPVDGREEMRLRNWGEDGTKTCGRYKNGKLVMDLGSAKGKLIGSFCGARTRLQESVRAASLAAYIADLKANIAAEHAAIAHETSLQAYKVHEEAHHQSDLALVHARQFHFADAYVFSR